MTHTRIQTWFLTRYAPELKVNQGEPFNHLIHSFFVYERFSEKKFQHSTFSCHVEGDDEKKTHMQKCLSEHRTKEKGWLKNTPETQWLTTGNSCLCFKNTCRVGNFDKCGCLWCKCESNGQLWTIYKEIYKKQWVYLPSHLPLDKPELVYQHGGKILTDKAEAIRTSEQDLVLE